MNRVQKTIGVIVCLIMTVVWVGYADLATASMSDKEIKKAWEQAEKLFEDEEYEDWLSQNGDSKRWIEDEQVKRQILDAELDEMVKERENFLKAKQQIDF